MKVHHITEAPKIEPKIGGTGAGTAPSGPKISNTKSLTGITGTKASFVNKSGGVSTGTIVGPAKSGNPNQVSFKDAKGKTYNVSVKKLLDPKTRTPLNIGGSASTTTAAPKADAGKAPIKADPKAKADAPKPKVDEDGWIKKLKGIANNKITRFLGKLVSGKIATAIVTALNFAQLEDALDAYLRALTAHGKKLDSQEAKQQYLENAKKGRLPQEVAEAYFICQEKWSKLIIEAFIAALVSGIVIVKGGAALAGLAGIIGTGPIGWIVAIVAGGALIWGGTTLLGKVFDAIGMNDIVEDYVVQPILSPNAMLSTGVIVDSFQNIIGVTLDAIDAPAILAPFVPDGDLVRDSIELDEGYVLISEGKTIPSKTEIKSNLASLMKAEPKLAKAFNKGKQQGKAAINDLI